MSIFDKDIFEKVYFERPCKYSCTERKPHAQMDI